MDIKIFAEKFGNEYEFLYDHSDRVAGYQEAVTAFDTLIQYQDFKAFVCEFNRYREDFISSDREAAAFMFACESFGLLDNETRI